MIRAADLGSGCIWQIRGPRRDARRAWAVQWAGEHPRGAGGPDAPETETVDSLRSAPPPPTLRERRRRPSPSAGWDGGRLGQEQSSPQLFVRPLSRAVPLTRRRGAAPCRAEVSELRDQLRQRTVELQEAVSFGMGIEWIM